MHLSRLACFLFGLSVAATASPLFTITDLGMFRGGGASAYSVNSRGEVVGVGQAPDLSPRAITSSDGMLRDITPLFAAAGEAQGINNLGQIAGTTYVAGRAQATLWQNGAAARLGDFGVESYGTAINDAGQLVGMSITAAGEGRPFVYGDGVIRDLGLPEGAQSASPYAINASGQIVGASSNSTGRFSAFVWSEECGYITIGTLGGSSSYAFAVNDAQQVVGSALTAHGYAHAFSYSAGVMRDLGTLGGNASYAYGINAAGAIVGYSLLPNGVTHAFLFDGTIMLDLNSLLENVGGWELTQAFGINESGQIVGSGLLNGQQHAILLNPVVSSRPAVLRASVAPDPAPEPATGVLLAGALALVCAWRYWRTATPSRD